MTRIISDGDFSCLYCSTTMVAFGPVHSGEKSLEDFLEWLPMDARRYDQYDLINQYYRWLDDELTSEGE